MALDYAIDKKGMTNSLFVGYYEALDQIGHPRFPETFSQNIQARAFDVARAKQLLAEAGKPNGFATEIIAQQTDDREALGAIQGYLRAVGIDASINAVAPARFSEIRTQGWKNGLMFDTVGTTPNYISPLLTAFDERGVYNRSIFRPTGFQATLDTAVAEPSDEKRQAMTRDFAKLVHDNAVVLALWTEPQLVATEKNVRGTGLNMRLRNNWNASDLWFAA
jgi:ABC-type transport system substrate-binding protein